MAAALDWAVGARKFLAALSGAAAQATALGLLDGAAERWVSGVLAVCTAFVVYLVPNAPDSAGDKGRA